MLKRSDLYFAEIKPAAEVAPSCENDEEQEDADEIMVELDAETLPPQESDSDGMFVHKLGAYSHYVNAIFKKKIFRTCFDQQNIYSKTHLTLRLQ